MKTLSFATALIGLGLLFSTLGGCETGSPGVKNYAGTYKMMVAASTEKTTDAAKKTVEEMKLADVSAFGTTVDGKVKARTAQGEQVIIDIKSAGENVSKVEIHVGDIGNDAVSQQIVDGIKSRLK